MDDIVATLCDAAIQKGAADAVPIEPAEVVTGHWVRLKCQFGCGGYGQCLTCPPHSPTPERTRVVLDGYSRAVLVHFVGSWQDVSGIVFELERTAFLAGYYKAFAYGCGPCSKCDECPLTYPCVHASSARPSMEACGIDVYATARKLNLPIKVVTSHEEQTNYYGLVVVD